MKADIRVVKSKNPCLKIYFSYNNIIDEGGYFTISGFFLLFSIINTKKNKGDAIC